MTAYVVAVDVGTTFTAAAVGTGLGGSFEATPLPLGLRTGSMPSVAYLPAAGAPLFGDDAEAHAAAEPDRVVREFTARVGDYVPIVVGERTVSAEEITAATVRHAVQVAAQRQGAPSELVVVSHPASWGSYKRHALGKALTDGGVHNVQLLSEPVAAAMRIAAHEDIEPGQVVAVYDLGGRSFDAAVLRRTADGFEVLGPPTGIADSVESTSTRPSSITCGSGSGSPPLTRRIPTCWRPWAGSGSRASKRRKRCRRTPQRAFRWCCRQGARGSVSPVASSKA